ncbi:ABC transporter permease subunit [Rhodococcus sp. IEGM 1366]|uniref:ABC transporter permease n=1 Tax=Rhodococcus sp. IEGM 1366 TaxID=3082223 RepID=UPI0029538678|nr:ABC transporter permease subunit [Rhodococcus sp. IEGM 1366]MDV8071153.1 ABC transporter permease subunit [Rhodococcus sp. IEGM 1366]
MKNSRFLGVLGTGVVLIVWQIVGMTGILGPGIAPPTAIFGGVMHDGLAFYGVHIPVTLASASVGYLWGNLAAIACAALVTTVPALEKLVLQVGIASACIPLIAIAPILAACFDGVVTSAIMAAVSVFFTTLVGTINGLSHADSSSEDLVRAYGGGEYLVLRKVQLMSALPSILTALKVAVPAAILGTIIGEFMGQERGLGAALVVAQSSSDVVRTWGITLVSSLIAGLAFLLVNTVEKIATPWAASTSGVNA